MKHIKKIAKSSVVAAMPTTIGNKSVPAKSAQRVGGGCVPVGNSPVEHYITKQVTPVTKSTN